MPSRIMASPLAAPSGPAAKKRPTAKAPGGKPQAPKPIGLRERHKQDKLHRIKTAARSVFISKGYDGATTREIAQLADVSHATVFLYAQDKRDLLFLVFNEDMDDVLAKSSAAVKKPGPLVDRLLRWYEPFLRFFSTEAPIGLLKMHDRGNVDIGPTPQSVSVERRKEIVQRELSGLFEAAVRSGELASTVDPILATRVVRSVFYGELDLWMRSYPHPSMARGLHDLRAALTLIISGMLPRQ
ncbi:MULTISPECIES: TetR/AcrR family transcriptional regulator [Stutzerimonas stutzeri subgroup]|jgi:AcrR family transcriptional regulator|uniref:TetR family transcriptional regulator n=1 Tax=Stutzerimonas stutzeri NF13 TaxID=1212548 RepID=M2UYJ5_STUST|nr:MULTISPECIES: TetR/AcrR family transcriptional regulator [Stutzerimonas stutzeri subgroup]EMD98651.1 TetR family transcriptional regulator [Stutzerimonas stutzeri NF13]MBK3882410.1 TetR family transcriptional regulator [Stutzerimonas stutzeri]MCQ4291732.1 TetR/AcrR family transcriptional regulator [Stutzerimonas stutzeri]WOF81113.1 TetR/AcrR family transcriptional regulator [Pseudomonas sp. FeN3W]